MYLIIGSIVLKLLSHREQKIFAGSFGEKSVKISPVRANTFGSAAGGGAALTANPAGGGVSGAKRLTVGGLAVGNLAVEAG